MARSRDRAAYDTQVLDVYLIGLQGELETKLRDIRRMREGLGSLRDDQNSIAQIDTARALLGQFDRMLVTNQVVRDTLLHVRDTAHTLIQRLLNSKRP